MLRNGFIKLSPDPVGGGSAPGTPDRNAPPAGQAESDSALDESYLAKGLTGMAQAESWFPAHLGAAVLAAYYLCRDNKLAPGTVAAIKSQIDSLIGTKPEQFAPLPSEAANEALIEEIPAALVPAIEGGLRAHGHAVIFASLSIRALREAPHLAQPKLISQLCGLSRQIAQMRPERPTQGEPYADSQEMVDALFGSLARFGPLLGRPTVRRPNFTHMTTHTEALLSLELLGYPELARAGQLGQRTHIGAPVPEFDPTEHPVVESHPSLEQTMDAHFWEDEDHRQQWNRMWNKDTNPNGYWIAFGHLFKVLYSYHRLYPRIADKKKVRLCSKVLLERYFNPDVDGG